MIYDTCVPRADVLAGAVEADFAADLARVLQSGTSEEYAEYADPVWFLTNTYPKVGLSDLLAKRLLPSE